jgi:hypothetical protein
VSIARNEDNCSGKMVLLYFLLNYAIDLRKPFSRNRNVGRVRTLQARGEFGGERWGWKRKRE